jgi:hypothetical protein
MRTIDRRVSELEHRFGTAHTKTTYVVVLMDAGSDLGTAQQTHITMLLETGSLHAGAFGVVDLSHIPDGLNAQEKEGFVREKGEGSRSARRPMHPVLSVVLDQA